MGRNTNALMRIQLCCASGLILRLFASRYLIYAAECGMEVGMKSFFCLIFKFVTLFIGIAASGILLVPAGALVMMISLIWKTTDKLVSRLEMK